jgi:hypothetical protein
MKAALELDLSPAMGVVAISFPGTETAAISSQLVAPQTMVAVGEVSFVDSRSPIRKFFSHLRQISKNFQLARNEVVSAAFG